MKFFLFILISVLLPVSTQKTHCLTQAEALEQVKNMDEKEYVERSLKTILYLLYAGYEQESQKYSEQDNFLPVELFLGYSVEILYNKYPENGLEFEKIYTKNLVKKIEYIADNYRKKQKAKYQAQKFFCNKLLGYDFDIFSCNEIGIYIYTKSTTKTLYLKDNTAIVELRYVKNPKYFGHFTLKKENGIWKLDRWQCGDSRKCDFYN